MLNEIFTVTKIVKKSCIIVGVVSYNILILVKFILLLYNLYKKIDGSDVNGCKRPKKFNALFLFPCKNTIRIT